MNDTDSKWKYKVYVHRKKIPFKKSRKKFNSYNDAFKAAIKVTDGYIGKFDYCIYSEDDENG